MTRYTAAPVLKQVFILDIAPLSVCPLCFITGVHGGVTVFVESQRVLIKFYV